MAEMVDALASGASGETRGSSNLLLGTIVFHLVKLFWQKTQTLLKGAFSVGNIDICC